jgi:GTP cyclohydrolase IB
MVLQSVGIKDYRCPVSIRQKGGGRQQTIARLSLQAEMAHDRQNSCITVLTGLLSSYRHDLHSAILAELLSRVRNDLQASHARLEMRFPYFITKKAPVSGTESLMEYQCAFSGSSRQGEQSSHSMLSVVVPVTTLCPCSKEISRAGAHNQRAEVTLRVQPNQFLWLEDLIGMVEQSGSCELYALLKRPDEKYVTEAAFANPMFVEDVARMVAELAMHHPAIDWFDVSVESFESIHKHSAYALVDRDDQVVLHLSDHTGTAEAPCLSEAQQT